MLNYPQIIHILDYILFIVFNNNGNELSSISVPGTVLKSVNKWCVIFQHLQFSLS